MSYSPWGGEESGMTCLTLSQALFEDLLWPDIKLCWGSTGINDLDSPLN